MRKTSATKSPLREQPLSLPGQGVDQRLRDLVFDEGLTPLLVATACWSAVLGSSLQALSRNRLPMWLFASAAIVVSVWAVVRFLRLRESARRLRLGRQGERHVGQLLQTLDLPGVRVFHDILADGFNLDHVVVCDRGIYVVETKTWSKPGNGNLQVREGRILFRGTPARGNPVGQAAAAARWLAENLHAEIGQPYRCQPVVVLPGWFIEPMDAATKAIAWVLTPPALLKWIPKDPVRLQQEDIRRIEGAISRIARRRLTSDFE